MFKTWVQLSRDAAMLAVEAQSVMGMRILRLSAGGPAAQAEAIRMISEKGTALTEATLTLAGGGSPNAVVRPNPCEVK